MYYLKNMKRDGIGPDITTYNTLLQIYGLHRRDLEKVEECVEEMDENGISKDLFTYSTLINIYGNVARDLHIDILLATMKAEGLKLDVTLCNTLLNLYKFIFIKNRNNCRKNE